MILNRVPNIYCELPDHAKIHTFRLDQGPKYMYVYSSNSTYLREITELVDLEIPIDMGYWSSEIDRQNPCELIAAMRDPRGTSLPDALQYPSCPMLGRCVLEELCCRKGILPDFTRHLLVTGIYMTPLSRIRGLNNEIYIDTRRTGSGHVERIAQSLMPIEWIRDPESVPYGRLSPFGLILSKYPATGIAQEAANAASMVIYTDPAHIKDQFSTPLGPIVSKPKYLGILTERPKNPHIIEVGIDDLSWLKLAEPEAQVKNVFDVRSIYVLPNSGISAAVAFGFLPSNEVYRTY